MSADGSFVGAVHDHHATTWDAETGAEVADAAVGFGTQPFPLAVAPDGSRVLTASVADTAVAYRLNTRITTELEGHGDRILDAAFDPRNGRIVTASRNGSVLVWGVDDSVFRAEAAAT